jgi:hypothetical protein
VWTAIWRHHGLRVAWVAAVMLLIAAHVALSVSGHRARPDNPGHAFVIASAASGELAEIADLPRIADDRLLALDIERRQDNGA